MDIEEEVKTHTRRVEAGERVRYGRACPHCGAVEEAGFRQHDCRRRRFRLVVGRCIRVALSWVLRWRCLHCDKRFTDCPPFALPRKRFVKQPVLDRAGEYLGTDQSYRRSTEHEADGCRLPIMYDDDTPAGRERASGLAPSTVWRWLSWLGGMPGTLRATLGLIEQRDPNATLHRGPWVVALRKYRSERRRDVLQRGMQLLGADRVCERLFGEGIFPRFATARGWS